MEALDAKPNEKVKTKTKEGKFVDHIIKLCQENKGAAAKLRRADNPNTEYQSWEIIAPWIDLEKDYERLPYITVAAAIARVQTPVNGKLSLGRAIALAYADKPTAEHSDQAKARLRRLLACSSRKEVCRVTRPILALVASRVEQPLNYAKLLSELCWFNERTKILWAKEFYGQRVDSSKEAEHEFDC
jgi:CRISPR system Cascade subunit CasB